MRVDFGFYLKYLRRHPVSLGGFVVVFATLVLMVIGPIIAPYPPETANPADYLQPPSGAHWFGTDVTGMDIFSRIISAPRTDLTIAITASVISLVIGCLLGAISGYFRGIGSEAIARSADLAQSFPLFVLAMALVAAFGQSMFNIILVLGVLNIPMFIRLVRSRVYSVRESPFIESARSIGATDLQIVFRHLLPNALPPALIQFSVSIGWAILLTAGLSFIGAGVRTPTPEWGLMIAVGAPNIMTGQWWPSVFPGLVIGITVMAYALVGDTLEHLLDPRRR